MATAFKLQGSYELNPLTAPLSFAQAIATPINEAKTLHVQQSTEVVLTVDTPVSVPFGGVTNANIVILKSVVGSVTARVTSAAGALQSVPFDTYWILMNDSAPITAIDLTRVAGVETTVRVFLAEKA